MRVLEFAGRNLWAEPFEEVLGAVSWGASRLRSANIGGMAERRKNIRKVLGASRSVPRKNSPSVECSEVKFKTEVAETGSRLVAA